VRVRKKQSLSGCGRSDLLAQADLLTQEAPFHWECDAGLGAKWPFAPGCQRFDLLSNKFRRRFRVDSRNGVVWYEFPDTYAYVSPSLTEQFTRKKEGGDGAKQERNSVKQKRVSPTYVQRKNRGAMLLCESYRPLAPNLVTNPVQ
jgi:hypothetical protein